MSAGEKSYWNCIAVKDGAYLRPSLHKGSSAMTEQ